MNGYDETLNWLEGHALICPFKFVTGCDCPVCGIQRSCFYLLKGEVSNSWNMHPAGIPLFVLIGFLVLHWKFKFSFGRTVIRIFLVFVILVTVVNYALKLYDGQCCI